MSNSFDLDRREFFKIAGTGGLVVLCHGAATPAPAEAEELPPPAGKKLPNTQIGAWLHIGEDGNVTVFTGKVEIGQNIRTSLAQAVADELGVAMDRIEMVMGDTARVPFDIGTFGSLTTAVMNPQLRKAAAAARGRLLDLAADKWKADRAELIVSQGRVEHPQSGRACGYGELARGQEWVEEIGPNPPLLPPDVWKVAGTSVPKVHGRDFVTGRHRYSSDMKRPGMAYGKTLRPPSFGATPTEIDTSKAEAIPGVTVVRDASFVGVAAADEPTASRALAAIRARWKTEPGECTDRDLFTYFKGQVNDRKRDPSRKEQGSLDDGLKAADVTLERSYTAAYIAHAPLEPRAALADWQDAEHLTVWTGTQRPFGVRSELAQTFRLPEENVRVLVPDTGSGYGGKHSGEVAIEAARLAKALGKPARVGWTREEEFTWGYYRPAGLVEAKAGASKDGKLTAWSFHNVNSGPPGMQSPYEVSNRVEEFHPVRSPLRQGAYRALASTFNHFARESLMDELAREIGMDPLEFRLKNLKDERLRDVFQAAAERFGWPGSKSKAGPGRGVGLAGGHDKGSCIATCAEVAIDEAAGTVKVVRVVAASEPGAIINPDNLKNQVEGCLMMGLGGALFEAIRFQDNRVRNPRFSQYRVPRFRDLPELDVVLLDRKDITPAGSGEIPIVAIAPAIANAIHDATGKRLRSMPMLPDGWKA